MEGEDVGTGDAGPADLVVSAEPGAELPVSGTLIGDGGAAMSSGGAIVGAARGDSTWCEKGGKVDIESATLPGAGARASDVATWWLKPQTMAESVPAIATVAPSPTAMATPGCARDLTLGETVFDAAGSVREGEGTESRIGSSESS
jgi:hypothetical protein